MHVPSDTVLLTGQRLSLTPPIRALRLSLSPLDQTLRVAHSRDPRAQRGDVVVEIDGSSAQLHDATKANARLATARAVTLFRHCPAR